MRIMISMGFLFSMLIIGAVFITEYGYTPLRKSQQTTQKLLQNLVVFASSQIYVNSC